MVHKCAAYGCRSGYKGETVPDVKISFHAFPLNNRELCERWMKANPRKDFAPTKHSKLCSLHFKPTDFVEVHRDSNQQRMKAYADNSLVRRHLKEDAVPSVFPNAPSYLSTTTGTPRSTKKASATSRREQQSKEFEHLAETFMADDSIAHLDLSGVADKLKTETTPEGFNILLLSQSCLLISIIDVSGDIPKMRASISVNSDLVVTVSVDEKIVPVCHFRDIVDGPVKQMSQLLNLMARVKSWCKEPETVSMEMYVRMAVQCLKTGLQNVDEEQEESRVIRFVTEQLQLAITNKFCRHYSPQLTVFCYMLNAASSSAYSFLRDEKIMCVPSVNTLHKVSRRLSAADGLDNAGYLKLRVSKLNEFERNTVLIIDEIYVAKRVEYTGGEMKGLTCDGVVASTLLCFMAKSVVSKYKDIVSIYPVHKLTADKLHECYLEVMELLRKVALNVVAISVDNAATNRKFFVDLLCAGTLQTHIIDATTGQPIFLIFDPVHDLKNVYNNFCSRRVFECPPMDRNLPDGCVAKFDHIVDLYNTESTMSLRKAHRLTPATLAPKNIEKTSVRLAASVFSESTRDALEFYAKHEDKTQWMGTALFVRLIIKLWNLMNVKSRVKGKHKRDITKDPVRSSMDWKVDFLREFATFLRQWELSRKPGLTRETFLALHQTCVALADCTCYLLDRRSFNYVLLGRLQSDAIERRFGWFRQMSGANYYISTRQVLESDRKIRGLSLLKFSKFHLSEIDEAIDKDIPEQHSASDAVADSIVDALQFNCFPSSSDANIVYYVSGYIVRSIVRSTRCDYCKECLTEPGELELESIPLDTSLEYSAATFLNAVNRGGLARPTDFAFSVTVHCWRVFEEIKSQSELLGKFLHQSNQQSLFCKVMERANCIQTFGCEQIENNICVAGHHSNDLIARRFFNCVAKNLAKDITNKANQQNDSSGKRKRKCAKLSSCSQPSTSF